MPDRIFHNKYPYLSSASAYWVNHAKQFAVEMTSKLSLDVDGLVIELGSNDGYLLSQFQSLGVSVLGVEPPENTAEIARKAGVPTISEFFGQNLAEKILTEYGHPKLIVVNNVFAHIPDMQDFTKGLSILAGEDSVITIENPSFEVLLDNALFDTIYHEHYSYLSAHSVRVIAENNGLNLVRVDRLPTHGGSKGIGWIAPRRLTNRSELCCRKKSNLDYLMRQSGLLCRSFTTIGAGLRNWLLEAAESGKTVVGYGAAHKGNTFLNAVGDTQDTQIRRGCKSREARAIFARISSTGPCSRATGFRKSNRRVDFAMEYRCGTYVKDQTCCQCQHLGGTAVDDEGLTS